MITIRSAELKDIKDIIEIFTYLIKIHLEFDRQYYRTGKNFNSSVENWIKAQIEVPSHFLFVSVQNNGISGFVSGYIKYLFPWYRITTVGHISFLVVKDEFQKKGTGKALMAEAEGWFKNKDLEYIEVFANEKNSAGVSAWKSYGFSVLNLFLRKKI